MIEFVKNFWCQKVLPLVYTDALSYYEELGKFVGKLNEVIGNVNNLNENTVFSVNNVKPVDGNVNVGTVKSVNGSTPDASGNVNLPQVSGVTSVDGVGADSNGNVPLNAVKSVNGIMPTNGNVNVGTVRTVNGRAPDLNGAVDGVTVESLYPYVGTWANYGDMYNFARNTAHVGKLYYCSVYHENDYQWWDTNKFGMGSFILTIMNVDADVAPLIEIRSLARGDIFILDRWGSEGNYTYPWVANYGANAKSVNNIAADDKGNINITADNVGAIASTPNAVGFQNVDAKGLYPKIASITASNATIDESWGKFVFLSNDVKTVTLESSVAGALSDSWHSIIMNGGSNNITVNLSAWLVDIDNGTNGMTTTFTLGPGKYIEIQRFSTAGLMLRGSFTRP